MTNDAQLVDDILKEMGESPGLEQQSNINSQALHYVMDGAHQNLSLKVASLSKKHQQKILVHNFISGQISYFDNKIFFCIKFVCNLYSRQIFNNGIYGN